MQEVSKEYRESMKSPLRERAYIKLSFGLINQEAQSNATLEEGEYAYYSNEANLFSEKPDNTVYATLEENFTKVDGTMFFPPRKTSTTTPYDTGLISEKLISEGNFTLKINLNILPTDIKGLTFNFGDNYPVDFDIVGSTGQTLQIRGNTQSTFVTEEVIEETSSITLVVYAMLHPHNRFRIYSILFGYGLIYSNSSVMSSSLTSYVSPIAADVPQIDFTVQVKNLDHYFNVDNPNSAINFFETGQEMNIFYGYQLPNSSRIEWIRGNRLLCSEWESDDFTATIRCQDVLRNMDSEYYKGNYNNAGYSYYNLAEDVLKDAGVEEYELDPCLKELYTTNPMPRVTHKEALQIIANACRCTLSQTRLGKVSIKSSVPLDEGVTDFTMTRNDMTSSPKAIKQELIKEVIVPCYNYLPNQQEETLLSEDITVTAGEEITFFLDEPTHNYRVTLNEEEGDVSIKDSGNYYVTLTFNSGGTFALEIFGHRYTIVERYAIQNLNTRGKTIKWENPLISNMQMATQLAEWLGEYYASGIEYEYNTRGNPEIDVSDVVYQENEFIEDMMVTIYRHTLTFNQSFSGKVTARRKVGKA
jgi:plastocyanin